MGAALLNLTGLSLGYLYLGRRRRAVAYLTITAALIAAAFLTEAAANPWPWRVLGGYWIMWQAAEGWWLTPRKQSRRRTVPVAVVAAVLVAAVVAGLLVYGAAGRAAYAAGRAAQSDGDCVTAIDEYDMVTGPYELTLSGTVAAAAASRQVCHEFLTATVIERFGDHADAVRRYHALRDRHPSDPLLPAVAAQLNHSYLSWAREHRDRQEFVQAIDVYRKLLADKAAKPDVPKVRAELAEVYLEESQNHGKANPPNLPKIIDNLTLILSEFPKTPAAAKVPQEIVNTLTLASKPLAEGRPCDAVPALDELAGLGQHVLTAGIAGQLHANRARATYQCGINSLTGGRYPEAVTMLEAFFASYPNDSAAPQARSALIAARVAEETRFPVSLPPPYAGNSVGDISVTFYNDSNRPVSVLVAGATAHEILLPACGGCPERYQSEEEACPTLDGRPSATMRLNAGLYHFIAVFENSRITTFSDTLALSPFFTYTNCLYVTAS